MSKPQIPAPSPSPPQPLPDQEDQSPPPSLHEVLLDYIVNSAYAGTAKSLSQPIRSTSDTTLSTAVPAQPDQLNNAGPSTRLTLAPTLPPGHGPVPAPASFTPPFSDILTEDVLASIDKRRAVINYILDGAIMRAVDALETHFPSVLRPTPPSAPRLSPGVVLPPGGGGGGGGGSSGGNGTGTVATQNGAGRSTNGTGGSGGVTGTSNGHTGHTTPASRTPVQISFAPPITRTSPPPLDHSVPVFARSSDPDHVRLNLQIQQFIESCRQLAPSSAPSSPSSSMSSLNGSTTLNGGGGGNSATLADALTAAQGLHTEAKKLRPDDRAVYLQEIKDVGALFAYNDPETSILKGFLEQNRRIALAQQVNAAILKSEGKQVVSHLEQIARRTSAVYATMNAVGIDPQSAWTSNSGDARTGLLTHWRISEHLKRQPLQKSGFSLREYVKESWR